MKKILFILSFLPLFLEAQTLHFQSEVKATTYNNMGVTTVKEDQDVDFVFSAEHVCMKTEFMNFCEDVILTSQSGTYRTTNLVQLSSMVQLFETSHSEWLVFLDADMKVFKVKEVPAVGPLFRIFTKKVKQI